MGCFLIQFSFAYFWFFKPRDASKTVNFHSYFNLIACGAKVEAVCKITTSLFSLEEILSLIKEAGFDITQVKEMLLTEERAEKIYFKIKGKDFYKDVLAVLSE